VASATSRRKQQPEGVQLALASDDEQACPVLRTALVQIAHCDTLRSALDAVASRRREQSRVDDASVRVVLSVDHGLDLIGLRPD
jgi:hypothetical protein